MDLLMHHGQRSLASTAMCVPQARPQFPGGNGRPISWNAATRGTDPLGRGSKRGGRMTVVTVAAAARE